MKIGEARKVLSGLNLDDLALSKGLERNEFARRMEVRRCAIERVMECGKLDYLEAYGVVSRVARHNRNIQGRPKDMGKLALRKCGMCGKPIWRAKGPPRVYCRIHSREMLLEKYRRKDERARNQGYVNRGRGFGVRKKEGRMGHCMGHFMGHCMDQKFEVELLEKIVTRERLVQIIEARGADLERYAAMIDELTDELAEKVSGSRLDLRSVLLEYIDAMEIKVWKQGRMWE